jgi:hypothetical protein
MRISTMGKISEGKGVWVSLACPRLIVKRPALLRGPLAKCNIP